MAIVGPRPGPDARRVEREGWEPGRRARPEDTSATLPVGRITPIEEDEDAFRALVVVESREGWLRLGIGEWRKEPFQSWWARVRESYTPADVADVGSLVVPKLPRTVCTDDTWTPIGRRLPGARTGHTAVWTGTEMIVWGGGTAQGERYDPVTDVWTALPSVGAPASQTGNTAVWTGQEMVIWGGSGPGVSFDPGARYNPSLDAWTPVAPLLDIAPGPITATWTGARMVVFGVVKLAGGESRSLRMDLRPGRQRLAADFGGWSTDVTSELHRGLGER